MPYSKSLSFQNVNQITFHTSATAVQIKVGGVDLGSINSSYPVTIYVVQTSSGYKLWMREITDAEYKSNNNNDPAKTVSFDQNTAGAQLHIEKCGGSNTFKIIGWEEEDNGVICSGGNGFDAYFNISNEFNFKAKMETLGEHGVQKTMMIVRYSQAIKTPCQGNATCSTNAFCYVCRV